jgi:hypothetical protein
MGYCWTPAPLAVGLLLIEPSAVGGEDFLGSFVDEARFAFRPKLGRN